MTDGHVWPHVVIEIEVVRSQVRLQSMLNNAGTFRLLPNTPSVPLYKVYLFFQKSNECMFDRVFRKIYQYQRYKIYII
jgi:hypothetical protein